MALKSRKGGKVPTILAGGNPRIAKADGDTPVQEYIARMPGWTCRGTSLRPAPPGASKSKDVRYLDIRPEVVEEWKWGVPVWSHDGLICTVLAPATLACSRQELCMLKF